MVYDTPPSQDAFTHQVWNSYLKEYAPDSMQILRSRSEVMVTVTQNPKVHPHTTFWIPISNNTIDMFRTRLF